MKKKTIALVLACILCVGIGIGGTLAWLTTTSGPVINTFTYGDIDIDLYEHQLNTDGSLKTGTNEADITRTGISTYKIVPSVDLNKDPMVVVKADSEACWLFVKIDENNWPSFTETIDGKEVRKVDYAVASGWTELTDVTGVTGVYYREVDAATAKQGTAFPVLADNKVTVSENLTKAEVGEITVQPTLTFTAYACQKDNVTSPTDAWEKINP